MEGGDANDLTSPSPTTPPFLSSTFPTFPSLPSSERGSLSPARQPAPSEWKRQAGRVSQDVSGRPPLPPAPRPTALAPYITPQAYTLPHCHGPRCSHAHASPPQAEAQLTPRAPPGSGQGRVKGPQLPAPCPGEPLPCGDMNSKLVQVHGVGGTGREEGGPVASRVGSRQAQLNGVERDRGE